MTRESRSFERLSLRLILSIRLLDFIERDAKCRCHSLAITLVGFLTVPDVVDLDEFGGITHRPGKSTSKGLRHD